MLSTDRYKTTSGFLVTPLLSQLWGEKNYCERRNELSSWRPVALPNRYIHLCLFKLGYGVHALLSNVMYILSGENITAVWWAKWRSTTLYVPLHKPSTRHEGDFVYIYPIAPCSSMAPIQISPCSKMVNIDKGMFHTVLFDKKNKNKIVIMLCGAGQETLRCERRDWAVLTGTPQHDGQNQGKCSKNRRIH